MLQRGKALSSPEIARSNYRHGLGLSSPEISRSSSTDYRHGHGLGSSTHHHQDRHALALASTPHHQDGYLEGISANVKLLLKLLHEQNLMIDHDDRKSQRMAGMISILDDVKSRIQKHSTPAGRPVKEFRRCNTDLKPHRVPRDKKSVAAADVLVDEKEKPRREIQANFVARKSLEAMCSSLGKEKEIMASELSRKVQELNGLEELIEDLKAQNATLLTKVQTCAEEHKDNCGGGDHHAHAHAQGVVNAAALQDRNRALAEQLMKSLDGYRSLKRRYNNTQEENVRFKTTIDEMGVEVLQGLGRIHGLKQRLATTEVSKKDIEKETSALQGMFQCLNMKISRHKQKRSIEED